MQLDARVDLIRNFSPDQFAQALESWDWIGIGDKSPVFASPFGDVFFRAADGLWWLDTLTIGQSISRRWTVVILRALRVSGCADPSAAGCEGLERNKACHIRAGAGLV